MGEEEEQDKGHGKNISTQGILVGALATEDALVKGEQHKSQSNTCVVDNPEVSNKRSLFQHDHHSYTEFKLPKLDFPVFDREHPKICREKCEKYFSLYNLPVNVWVPFATMNFRGNAALWLQTYEAQHSVESWLELYVAVDQKFGRELYQNYMRDMLFIKQTVDSS